VARRHEKEIEMNISEFLQCLDNITEVPTGWRSSCPLCGGDLEVRPHLKDVRDVYVRCDNHCRPPEIMAAVVVRSLRREVSR
jgi:hypothetical protein